LSGAKPIGAKGWVSQELNPSYEFPDNRENNREFCEFAAIQAIPNVNSRSNSNVLYVNSLSVRNREIFRANREFIRPNRESSPPIGFMETVCQPSENAFRSMTREWRRVNPQATGVTPNGEIRIAATCNPAVKESI